MNVRNKTYITGINSGNVNWIELAQYRFEWRILVLAVLTFWVILHRYL